MFYRHEGGRVTWHESSPWAWPVLEVYGGFWSDAKLKAALFRWYGLVELVPGKDRVLIAWLPLAPLLKLWYWLCEAELRLEYRFFLRPYLKLMGRYEEGQRYDFAALRRMVWLGSWQ